jgi:hypothetical protein
MTTALESSAARPDCTAVADEFARRMKGVETESLRVALQLLRSRQGTAMEQPCDAERVWFLEREITNQLTIHQLRTGLRQLGIPPASF